LINPNNQLIIDGACNGKCRSRDKPAYKYNIYVYSSGWRTFIDYLNILPSIQLFIISEKLFLDFTISYIVFKGTWKPELVLPTTFFQNYSSYDKWKIDLVITIGQVEGSSSMQFKKNSLPSGGKCGINKFNGTSLSTYFDIICVGWWDPDGKIETYEFFGIQFFFKPNSYIHLIHFYLSHLRRKLQSNSVDL